MPNELHNIEEFEVYTEKLMGAMEARSFEQRVASDPALAEELAAYRTTRSAVVEFHNDQHVRALLKGVEQRTSEPERNWLRWAAAAAVVIGLGATATFLATRPTDLPSLAAEFQVPESGLPVYMSAGLSPQVIMDQAMQAYGSGDHAEALEQLSQLPTTDTVLFFTALCNIQLGHDPTASLQAVATKANSVYRTKALYHLMLHAMSTNDRGGAQWLWAQQMLLPQHPYRKQLEAISNITGWTP